METGVNIVSRERAYVSTDDPVLIRRINRLSDENPDSVTMLKDPSDNDGCWYGTIPTKWVKISPPRKVEYSDEQRAAMAERLSKMRLKSRNENDEQD